MRTSSGIYRKKGQIGHVSKIALLPDYKILVQMEIDPHVQVFKEDTVALVFDDFIRDQWIEVVPGLRTEKAAASGDTLTAHVVEKHVSRLGSSPIKTLLDSIEAQYSKKE